MRLFFCFLFTLCLVEAKAQYFDTVHLYYDIGAYQLSDKQKAILDELYHQYPERKLLIYSYADYLGKEQPNYQLSDKRALQVKQYFLAKGMPEQHMLEVSGLGQIAATKDLQTQGDAQSRRTDIFIRRERTETIATTPVRKEAAPVAQKNNQGALPVVQAPEHVTENTPPLVTKIDISTLKEQDVLRLEHIEFWPGSTRIMAKSYAEVENLYHFMDSNPKVRICLEGHICCCVYPDGFFDDTPTWGLSVDRAKTIYEHLITRGIEADRMQYKGFGRTRPIRDNERTVEEGQVNRRVEVRILAK